MKDTHPLIAFSYFVAVISLTMCAAHPVLAALSLAVALLYLLVLKGWVAALRQLAFALLVVAVVTVFNMVFVHAGFTVIFYFMKNPITLEATLYGCSLGLMLSAVLMWFSCYQEVVGSDRFLALFSRVVPTSAMMVSMIFNFIPQVLSKARQIDDAYKALAYEDKTGSDPTSEEPMSGTVTQPAADTEPDQPVMAFDLTGKPIEAVSGPEWLAPKAKPGRRAALAERLRWPVKLSSILMGWSMETGLTTAASMRARAYGSTRRSSYLPLHWTLRDGVLLGIMAGLLVVAAVGEYFIMKDFIFYPRMSHLADAHLYLLFVAFASSPLVYEGGIRLKWRLSSY